MGSERLSWRRLGSLIRHLPRESHYVAATAGPAAAWGATEHLLAAVIDVIQAGNWQYASAHSKTRIPRPKPLPRPGDNQGRKMRGYTIAELQRRLAESNGPNSPYRVIEATTL